MKLYLRIPTNKSSTDELYPRFDPDVQLMRSDFSRQLALCEATNNNYYVIEMISNSLPSLNNQFAEKQIVRLVPEQKQNVIGELFRAEIRNYMYIENIVDDKLFIGLSYDTITSKLEQIFDTLFLENGIGQFENSNNEKPGRAKYCVLLKIVKPTYSDSSKNYRLYPYEIEYEIK